MLTTLAKEHERKDEEKKTRKTDHGKPNKALEEKRKTKKIHQVSLSPQEISDSITKTLEQKTVNLDTRHQLREH